MCRDHAVRILACASPGTITLEEAFHQPAIVMLSESEKIEASIYPRDTWTMNGSVFEINRIKAVLNVKNGVGYPRIDRSPNSFIVDTLQEAL
jgi:hypothetical protein